MIQTDQPTCFPPGVLVRVSSKYNGTVLNKAVGTHEGVGMTNRQQFCSDNGVEYRNVVYQRIKYGDDHTYDVITDVDASDTTEYVSERAGDALFTRSVGVGLFLPVADCIATVIYDPSHKYLALLHLGRHSTMANLMSKTIDHFVERGSKAEELIIWMAPSVQKSHYVMQYFDHKDEPEWQGYVEVRDDGIYLDLHGYNHSQALEHGVLAKNIHQSDVNTAIHPDYYSHSQGDKTGRFAVLAIIQS